MINRDDVLAILREYKRDNAQKYGIIDLGLFGSVARQTVGENSDVDICIKTQTADPFILVHIKDDLEQRVHAHVDIVRVREKMNLFLKARIEKEGLYV